MPLTIIIPIRTNIFKLMRDHIYTSRLIKWISVWRFFIFTRVCISSSMKIRMIIILFSLTWILHPWWNFSYSINFKWTYNTIFTFISKFKINISFVISATIYCALRVSYFSLHNSNSPYISSCTIISFVLGKRIYRTWHVVWGIFITNFIFKHIFINTCFTFPIIICIIIYNCRMISGISIIIDTTASISLYVRINCSIIWEIILINSNMLEKKDIFYSKINISF